MIRSHKATASGLATALAIGALAAPSAFAQPADVSGPNAGATQHASGTDDRRSPDTQDAAQGRRIVASTPVEIVRVKHSSATGFDWGDAAIGAGGTMGAVILCLGGTVALTRRRRVPTATSNAARLAG